MPSMFKNFTESQAEVLLGSDLMSMLSNAWSSLEDDPHSTSLFDNLRRRALDLLEEPANYLQNLPHGIPKTPWKMVYGSESSSVHNTLNWISGSYNADVAHLMKIEGMEPSEFWSMAVKHKGFKKREMTTYYISSMSDWGLLNSYSSHENANSLQVFFDNIKPVLDIYNADMKNFVKRINEMRKSPNFIDYMREHIAAAYLVEARGDSKLGDIPGNELTLNIMGLNEYGELNCHHWVSSSGSKFKEACQSLILDIAEKYNGKQPSPEFANITYVESICYTLTVLPSHILLMQGADPVQVLKGAKARINFLLDNTVEFSEKDKLRESILKICLMNTPEHWDLMSITAPDFLGIDIRGISYGKDIISYGYRSGSLGVGTSQNSKHIRSFAVSNGANFSDEDSLFRLGFGYNTPFSLKNNSEAQIQEAMRIYHHDRGSFPKFVTSDLSIDCIHDFSAKEAGRFFITTIQAKANQFYDYRISRMGGREGFLKLIAQLRPEAVAEAFALVADGEYPAKLLPKIEPYGIPTFESLQKLPARYRDKYFSADLGL